MTPRVLRAGLVVLLVGGAYLAAQPWLECTFPFGAGRWYPEMWGLCSFGTGNPAFDRTGPGPLWPRLAVAAVYLFAAAQVALGRVTIARRESRTS
jgi:hypothetical protein